MQKLAEKGGVLVSHAMTSEVISIRSDASLWEAVRTLREAVISGMPVVDAGGRLVGVLSEKDIARALQAAEPGAQAPGILDVLVREARRPGQRREILLEILQNTRVSEVMSRDPIVASPDTPLDTAARIMFERRINRLPVVDGHKLIGILTRHDILGASV